MPFKSRSQLQTCYKKQTPEWDCTLWLDETTCVCCLPNKKEKKTRLKKPKERIIGKIQIGPKGGRFFTIEEKNSEGTICVIKVYLPKE